MLAVAIGTSGLPQGAAAQAADRAPQLWYVQAGASGDGSNQASPLGSTAQVEATSRPGEVIVLLAASRPLDDGLALKPRQMLRGLPHAQGRPVLTNTAGTRNGGNGLVLADGVRVEAIDIRDTHASGVFGSDVGGAEIVGVRVTNANTGQLVIPAVPGNPVAHGGITVLDKRMGASTSLDFRRVHILQATGVGVTALATGGANVTLDVRDSEVRDGSAVGGSDFGVAALASGDSSTVALNLIRSAVSGRMSVDGRNVIVVGSNGGQARGLVHDSYVGRSGQDGVIAVAYQLPAQVELTIVGSTLENAAQSNVEGTMLAFPHDSAAAAASRVDVSIHRSAIRGAGRSPGFEDGSFNVMMTGSLLPPGLPMPPGAYRLRVTDSAIEGSEGFGLRIGTRPGRDAVDPGQFDVLVQGTRFLGNAAGDLVLDAAALRVDARCNCWISPKGERCRAPRMPPLSSPASRASPYVLCARPPDHRPRGPLSHDPGTRRWRDGHRLAEEPSHGREAALKGLRPELAATMRPDRFFREFQIAARLQQAHMRPSHDSGACRHICAAFSPRPPKDWRDRFASATAADPSPRPPGATVVERVHGSCRAASGERSAVSGGEATTPSNMGRIVQHHARHESPRRLVPRGVRGAALRTPSSGPCHGGTQRDEAPEEPYGSRHARRAGAPPATRAGWRTIPPSH